MMNNCKINKNKCRVTSKLVVYLNKEGRYVKLSSKIFFKFSSLIIIFALCVSFIIPSDEVSAAEIDDSTSTVLSDIPESVDFDLTKNEKQEFTFVDDEGNEVTYGAEPVSENVLPSDNNHVILPMASYPISSGKSTWHIYHYSGAINMSYYITISRSGSTAKITNAYNLSVTLIGYSENNRQFGFTSKKAEYTGSAILFNAFLSLSIRLTATVSGTTLKTSAKS